MTFYIIALLPKEICSVSGEMLIKRFKKLLGIFLGHTGLQLALLIVLQSDISSLLKMIKFVYLCLLSWFTYQLTIFYGQAKGIGKNLILSQGNEQMLETNMREQSLVAHRIMFEGVSKEDDMLKVYIRNK